MSCELVLNDNCDWFEPFSGRLYLAVQSLHKNIQTLAYPGCLYVHTVATVLLQAISPDQLILITTTQDLVMYTVLICSICLTSSSEPSSPNLISTPREPPTSRCVLMTIILTEVFVKTSLGDRLAISAVVIYMCLFSSSPTRFIYFCQHHSFPGAQST